MEAFKKLSNPDAQHSFVQYASFYYALSAYKNGDLGLARSMWLQVKKKYPKWENIKEVNFWLAQVYFEEGNYSEGIRFAKLSETNQVQGLIDNYVSEIEDIKELEFLNQQYPEDKIVAVNLANAMVKLPFSERNFSKLEQISSQFNLGQSSLGLPEIGNSFKKETYNVAVVLPFMFDSLSNIRRISRNKFVMDIYEGILEAVDTLNSTEKIVNVFPYDTKRDVTIAKSVFEREEMKSMDLIIGPLFPEPSKVASDFCFDNKINMINPVSSNIEVVNNNPYSFLFKPADEIKAQKMADYAIESFENKRAFVFYDSTERDSVAAHIYKEKIAKEGFDVIHFLQVSDHKIADAHELLVGLYEVGLNEEQRDSIMLIDERLVKEKKVKSEEDEEIDSVFYYQEFFNIAADSIGHIFVSSSKPLHASSFISAVEIRPDTIPILTNVSWTNFDMLTIDQMERLSIKFADPDFINFNKESYKMFRQKILRKYKKEPSINNCIGYDLMYYTGLMMKEYGHYFQKGALQSGTVQGQIFEGINYSTFNSNQYVPIVTFENAELKNINDQ